MTHLVATTVDWGQVMIVGIPAIIASVGSSVAAIIAALSHRAIKTPSGAPIGHVVERTHDLAAVNAAGLGMVGTDAVSKSIERLNGDPSSAIHVENGPADE